MCDKQVVLKVPARQMSRDEINVKCVEFTECEDEIIRLEQELERLEKKKTATAEALCAQILYVEGRHDDCYVQATPEACRALVAVSSKLEYIGMLTSWDAFEEGLKFCDNNVKTLDEALELAHESGKKKKKSNKIHYTIV